MNIALWIVQGLMAAMFLMAGANKMIQSKEKLKGMVGAWVDDFSGGSLKLIGLLEVLGALGLVLPMVLDVLPVLTPAAALGLALTMVGAFIVHARRGEKKEMGMNVVLLLLVAFIAYGRLVLLPVV